MSFYQFSEFELLANIGLGRRQLFGVAHDKLTHTILLQIILV